MCHQNMISMSTVPMIIINSDPTARIKKLLVRLQNIEIGVDSLPHYGHIETFVHNTHMKSHNHDEVKLPHDFSEGPNETLYSYLAESQYQPTKAFIYNG